MQIVEWSYINQVDGQRVIADKLPEFRPSRPLSYVLEYETAPDYGRHAPSMR